MKTIKFAGKKQVKKASKWVLKRYAAVFKKLAK
jgi:hypothetical protein